MTHVRKQNELTMDFAKEQLSKHGWTEGQGLGKTESGITEAIKVKIKQNKTGVGHDPGEEFSFHWWDHVFNKAASKIKVKTTENGVEIENAGDTKVTKKKDSKTYCNKDMLYGQFVKGATLSDGTETKEVLHAERSEEEEQTETVQCLMPDQAETVFKMCGGRTAHKGARHGHKLNGKLHRIEEQERLLLESYKASKKSQVHKSDEENCNDASNKVNQSVERKSKKDKKRKRKCEKTVELNELGNGDVEGGQEGAQDSKPEDMLVINDEHVDKVKSKKRKKSKRNREIQDDGDDSGGKTSEVKDIKVTEMTCDDIDISNCDKKKKKKKRKHNTSKE